MREDQESVDINKSLNFSKKLASIILLSYNSRKDLKECIPSLTNQTYPNYEIIVVDNASTDNTPEFMRTEYPEIKLVETGSNLGYPAGNNIGFEHSRGLYEPSTSFSKNEEVGAISGCSFAVRKEVFKELGGFDPDLFLYLEDVDLSWRARLAGYRILFVPASVVYHKFRLSIAPWKEFYLERNRYLMLLKNCSLKMLILMNPGKIMKKRHDAQMNRRINDKECIRLLEWEIPFEQVIQNRFMRIAADKILKMD